MDSVFLPNVHDQVVAALRGARRAGTGEALGVVETATVAATIEAADAGVKGAAVELLELRLGDGLGGKGYLLFDGSVADVEAAVAIAVRADRGRAGGLRARRANPDRARDPAAPPRDARGARGGAAVRVPAGHRRRGGVAPCSSRA